MPSRSFQILIMTLLACVMLLLPVGCSKPVNTSSDNPIVSTDSGAPALPSAPIVSEPQAMQIALTGLDTTLYQATSTITGPLEMDGQEIEVYEVTVKGIDDLVLRYVDANSGELFTERDAWHDLPDNNESVDTGAPPPPSWYTSCPAGWPLCIRTPSSITFYSQSDTSWSRNPLGSGPSTIGSAGCLLTSYAMAICQNHGTCVNPGTLNTAGQAGRCFSGSNLTLDGSGAHSCITGVEGASNTKIDVSLVWSTLASGKAVVAFGTSDCFGGTHAQMIWGHDGSRYWTKDPAYAYTNQDQSLCLSSVRYFKVL